MKEEEMRFSLYDCGQNTKEVDDFEEAIAWLTSKWKEALNNDCIDEIEAMERMRIYDPSVWFIRDRHTGRKFYINRNFLSDEPTPEEIDETGEKVKALLNGYEVVLRLCRNGNWMTSSERIQKRLTARQYIEFRKIDKLPEGQFGTVEIREYDINGDYETISSEKFG
jgi:hypothetical protein